MPSRKIEDLPDVELLALCIYGEARDQGLDGMLAVGSVVMNRVKEPAWWGNDIKTVILKPLQFSCFNDDNPFTSFNEGDPNRGKLGAIAEDFDGCLKTSGSLRCCYWIARGIIEGSLDSNVRNATHYHTFRSKPAWRNKLEMITKIGDHIFYA